MSEEFNRDALFSDIDKIMEKQGYHTISSSSSPVEIEASDTVETSITPPKELLDKIEQVINPRVEEETPVQPVIREDDDEIMIISETEQPLGDFNTGEIPEIIAEPEPEPVVPHVQVQPVAPAPEPIPEPEPQPVPEPVSASDPQTSSKFTTIDTPMNWSQDKEPPTGNSDMYTEPDRPAVSYLEGASTDGVTVENVAFGDISVGVETESVEYSVGHPLLRLLRNILICVAAALVLSLVITKFVAHHTAVDGSSMSTTLTDGDQLIVQQLSYYFHDPERFDIVVFPISTEDNYIKRVIGLPGETVQIINGQVYINGKLLTDDKYGNDLIQDPGTAADTIYLQADEYFVLGDNRNGSVDSRFPEVGLIHKKDIKGKAWLRFYPLGSFGFVN
ncbi:MAG: signal peptidase I [Eubacterium sp.]|nr:signal peptidase I [Eubacterium sp.]